MNLGPTRASSWRWAFDRLPRERMFVGLVLLLAAGVPPAQAQLAITEIMSSSLEVCDGGVTAVDSDFWELTNFGDNIIDLTGYQFNDGPVAGPVVLTGAWRIEGISIAPGESIIFFQKPQTALDA